ncbi:iron-containing alcohol dehydrogenase [Vibrio sp. 404]|uniref:Iron-containing alcohol dehydrogenase n=1 Tax=Vibrio marinisediminis TaxID=2758441 RepID=A0A7W2FS78_9VIBR|nr:iron-containing alcohol dehydrogenase [Vibrio marinisediminis]MBA5763291.1 iron-containing alcohol dehydrogenase [Vibrio marinisediminis]
MIHQLLVSIKEPFLKLVPVSEPECIIGAGSVGKLADTCQRYNVTKPLIVTDQIIHKLGLLDSSFTSLSQAKIPYSLYDDVEQDPDYQTVRHGVEQYKSNQCDGIVAFGGGSVIDCAKAIGASVKTNKDISRLPGLLKVLRRLMPIIAIPTTAGTGSECTVAAVVSDKEKQIKQSITDPFLVPKVAIIDPAITLGLPLQITAETGIDALTHAIESYLSSYSNTYTQGLSISAIKLIFKHMPNVFANGHDIVSREKMALASYQAGLAFTRTYIGYVHAIAHQLGALYHVPHGRANAIVLTHVLRFYQERSNPKLLSMSKKLGFDSSESLISTIDELLEQIEIPKQLKELEDKDISKIATAAIKEAFGDYPVPEVMTTKDCERILTKLLNTNTPTN